LELKYHAKNIRPNQNKYSTLQILPSSPMMAWDLDLDSEEGEP
jgi:hypothetical protein